MGNNGPVELNDEGFWVVNYPVAAKPGFHQERMKGAFIGDMSESRVNDNAIRDLERYYELLNVFDPSERFSESELNACVDACWNLFFDTRFMTTKCMVMEVSDGDKYSGIGAKWGVDICALVDKLRGLNELESLAFADAIERRREGSRELAESAETQGA